MIRRLPIRMPFRYAAGASASRFFEVLRDQGRILGRRCTGCRRVLCPARAFCTLCGEPTDEWVEVGPGGELLSWTEIPDRGAYALVRLDGGDTAMLHRLLADGASPRIGDRVRARLAAARAGGILDLEGFELLGEGEGA